MLKSTKLSHKCNLKNLKFFRIWKSMRVLCFKEWRMCSNTSIWIEHDSDCSSHCFGSDISSKFDFDLAGVSMGCHYLSPAHSVSGIIYCVFYFVNKRNSFSQVPSSACLIITVLNSYKSLVFLLWHSWSYKSSEYTFHVQSHWLWLFVYFFLSCFYFFCHYLL